MMIAIAVSFFFRCCFLPLLLLLLLLLLRFALFMPLCLVDVVLLRLILTSCWCVCLQGWAP